MVRTMDKEDLLIDVENAVEGAKKSTRNLVPWLEDPKTCEECGVYCLSTHEYVDAKGTVGYTDVWRCPECGKRYYRDRV